MGIKDEFSQLWSFCFPQTSFFILNFLSNLSFPLEETEFPTKLNLRNPLLYQSPSDCCIHLLPNQNHLKSSSLERINSQLQPSIQFIALQFLFAGCFFNCRRWRTAPSSLAKSKPVMGSSSTRGFSSQEMRRTGKIWWLFWSIPIRFWVVVKGFWEELQVG